MKPSDMTICSKLWLTLLPCLLAFPAVGDTFVLPRIEAESSPRIEWAGQGLQVAITTRMSHVGSDEVPTGEARVRLGWHEDGLLLSFEVIDADRIEGPTGRLYRGDSVEIFVAKQVGADDLFQVIAAPGIRDGEFDQPRYATYLNGREVAFDAPVAVTGESTDKGYWLQVIIPWQAVGLGVARPQDLALQFFVNDRDVPIPDIGDAYLRYMEIDHLGWFPDRTTVQDHTRMHRVELAEQAESATSGVVAEVKMAPGRDRIELTTYLPRRFEGQSLEVLQDGRRIASAACDPQPLELATAHLGLPARDALTDSPLELRVGDEHVGRVELYGKLSLDERMLLDRVLKSGDESERWLAMVALQGRTSDQLLQRDLAVLEPLVNLWVNGKALALHGQVVNPNQYLMFHVNPVSPPALRRDSPIYPIFCLYRARNIIWRGIQGGEEQQRLRDYQYARQLLAEAHEMVPENPLIGMYLDQPIPWPGVTPHPDAPDWANDQRECLEKIRQITHFWIDQRLLPSGTYGGDWNDDVEMWRNWWPVMFAFDDPESVEAQRLLTDAIFAQPHMKDGYSAVMDDVEHSAEDSADTLTPMLFLEPDNPQWRAKALNIARLMRDVWTGENERGQLAFKSIVMNATGVSGGPHNAYDTTLSFRAVQPTLVYWQQTHDPALTPQFTRWFDTWVAATATSENGKPAGVLPSSIHWPSGRPGGPNHWWLTEGFSSLYDWPQYVGDALGALLIGYEITGDEKYLQPIISMATLRRDLLRDYPGAEPEEFEAGSTKWAAAQMGPLLPGALMSYRVLTGDTQFDEVLKADGNAYTRYLISGDMASIAQSLQTNRHTLSYNRASYTTEVRWTDRVYRYVKSYYSYFSNDLAEPDTRFVYLTLTGDTTTWPGSRLPAVRWMTPPKDFAALVTHFDKHSFEAQVFHFGDQPREMSALLPRLEPGRYEVSVSGEGLEALVDRQTVNIVDDHKAVELVLPPGCLISIVIRQ